MKKVLCNLYCKLEYIYLLYLFSQIPNLLQLTLGSVKTPGHCLFQQLHIWYLHIWYYSVNLKCIVRTSFFPKTAPHVADSVLVNIPIPVIVFCHLIHNKRYCCLTIPEGMLWSNEDISKRKCIYCIVWK